MVTKHNKNKTSSRQQWLFISFVASAIFFIDQITKFLIRKYMPTTNNGILDITFTKNTGSLFGLFDKFGGSNLIFIVLSILAISLLVLSFREEKNTRFYLPLGLVIGGILGNFIDRIFFFAVIDWIQLPYWPIFNLADVSLVLGVLFLLIFSFQEELTTNKKTSYTTNKKKKKKQRTRARKK